MFYSNFILVKKGPLSKVWLAAHWQRRLTKTHIAQCDIDISAKAILNPQTPLALRLSGQLLLGLVRIYSRKVQYLQEDASDALTKIKMVFRPGVVDLPEQHRTAKLGDITLPDPDMEFTIPDLPDAGPVDLLLLGDEDWTRERLLGEKRLTESERRAAERITARPEAITMEEEKGVLLPPPAGEEDLDIAGMGIDFDRGISLEEVAPTPEAARAGEELKAPTPEVARGALAPRPEDSALDIDDTRDEASRLSGIDQALDTSLIPPTPIPPKTPDVLAREAKELEAKELEAKEKAEAEAKEAEMALEEEKEEKVPKPKKRRREREDERTELASKDITLQLKDTKDIVVGQRDILPIIKKHKVRSWRQKYLEDVIRQPFLAFNDLDPSIPGHLPSYAPEVMQAMQQFLVPGLPRLPAKEREVEEKPEEVVPEMMMEEEELTEEARRAAERLEIPEPELSIEGALGESMISDISREERKIELPPTPEVGAPPRPQLDIKEFFEETGPKDMKEQRLMETGWSKRTRKMLQLISNEMQAGQESISFFDLTKNASREVAAAVFYQLLVLKTHKSIDVQQEKSYEDITITKDENFRLSGPRHASAA